MRRLQRPEFAAPTLREGGLGGRKREEHVSLYLNGGAPPSFPDYWKRPDVRGLLCAMQHRVCAYCGMRTKCLDVDHFRPKGRVDGDENHGGLVVGL